MHQGVAVFAQVGKQFTIEIDTNHLFDDPSIAIPPVELSDGNQFNVALVVGGSITIPHLRRAFERMDEVLADRKVVD